MHGIGTSVRLVLRTPLIVFGPFGPLMHLILGHNLSALALVLAFAGPWTIFRSTNPIGFGQFVRKAFWMLRSCTCMPTRIFLCTVLEYPLYAHSHSPIGPTLSRGTTRCPENRYAAILPFGLVIWCRMRPSSVWWLLISSSVRGGTANENSSEHNLHEFPTSAVELCLSGI